MPTMKSVLTAGPGKIEVAEIERPAPGPRDVLLRIRACGICGTDAAFVQMGGMPRAAKWGARLVTVAVHKKPEPIDLGAMLRSEMTIIASQGYPTEIFEVTPQIAEHQQRFSRLISHHVPFSDAVRAFQLALTPGAAEKVVVTFND